MYWYIIKGPKNERREVADWIVHKMNQTAEEYFNNPAIKKWGHTEDEKEK